MIVTPLLRAGDKAVLTAVGTMGDIVPFVAVGRALRSRGVRVVVASSDFHRGYVESEGLAFVPLPPTEAQVHERLGMTVQEVMRRGMHKLGGPRFAARALLGPFLRESYEQLARACDDANLLLSHVYSFAAPLVAERLHVPWRSLCLQPLPLLSPYDPGVLSELVPLHRLQPLLGPERYRAVLRGVKAASRHWFADVDALREALGLPRSFRHPLFEGALAPDGAFGLFDPLMLRDPRGLPDTLRILGFAGDDGTEGRLGDDLTTFLDRGAPPVVFTLGSSAVHNPGPFFEIASAACLRLGLRAVLLTGASRPAPSLPTGQIAVPAASHRALFPHARAIVHQGGIGTSAQALRAGKPQVVVPFGNDQPDNAARLAHLGVAAVVRSWRMRRLPRALDDVLDPALAARAASLVARLLPGDGTVRVAEHLLGPAPPP